MKSAFITGLGCRHAGKNHSFSCLNAFFIDILVNRIPCGFFKLPHQIELADITLSCQHIHIDFLCQMFLYIGNYIYNLLMIGRCGDQRLGLLYHIPVEQNHEFQERTPKKKFIHVRLLLFRNFLHAHQAAHDPLVTLRCKMCHPSLQSFRLLEAKSQAFAPLIALRQKFFRQIDDIPLVRHTLVNFRSVDTIGAHQDRIMGFQMIGLALNFIVCHSVHKIYNLVKIMIMKVKQQLRMIPQMKHFKRLCQIPCLFILYKFLCLFHNRALPKICSPFLLICPPGCRREHGTNRQIPLQN